MTLYDRLSIIALAGSICYAGWCFKTTGHNSTTPSQPDLWEAQLTLPPADAVNSVGPSDNVPVVIELGDDQCPYCLLAQREIEPPLLQLAVAGKIRFISWEFPLPMHQFAEKAAEASLCAGDQHKPQYWHLRGILRETLTSSARGEDFPDLEGLANFAKVPNAIAFRECVSSGRYKGLIGQAVEVAKKQNVKGTPTFFVGRQAGGQAKGTMFMSATLEKVEVLIKKYGGVVPVITAKKEKAKV